MFQYLPPQASGFRVRFQKVRAVCSIDGTLSAQEIDAQHAQPVPEHGTHFTLPADQVVFALTGAPSSFFLRSLLDTLVSGVQ